MPSYGSLRLLICAALALLLLVGAFFIATPPRVAGQIDDAGGEAVRLVSSDAEGVVLDLTVPSYAAETVEVEGRVYQRLSIDGYPAGGEPGEPELPQRGFLLGVPPRAEVSLTILSVESTVARGFHIAPVAAAVIDDPSSAPSGERSLAREPSVDRTYSEDSSIYARDAFFPAAVVELGESGYLRDQRTVQVLVHPLQVNPLTGEVRHYHRLKLAISFRYPDGLRTSRANRAESASFERVLEGALLNYEAARDWRSGSHQVQAPGAAGDYLTPPSYKVTVEQDGIYQLSYEDLRGAGVLDDDPDPHTFKLFNMGSEVAIHLEHDGDKTFEPSEHVVFYGQQMDTKYTNANVYWLRYGGSEGLRMAITDGTPGGAADPLVFENAIHLEEDHEYWSFVPMEEGADHWYWDYWHTRWARELTFDVSLAHISPGPHTCTLYLSLYGGSDGHHHGELLVNGTTLGEISWDGMTAHQPAYTFDQSLLQHGLNTITLRTLTPSSARDTALVDWFKLAYYDTYVAEGDRLRFNGDLSDSQPISHTYHVSGFSTADVDAFDVTDPSHPRSVSGATVSGSGPYTLIFQDSISQLTQYLALTLYLRLSPSAIVLDEPSNLRALSEGADYIVISQGDFLNDVQPLADHRAAQGLRAAVVDVQEVYDTFSYGVFDPRAIRAFLAYAYANWIAPPPAYVVLVGDGHYDFKDNLGTGAQTYVPPFLAMVDPTLGETAADNRYVTVSGGDTVPDMHIGRLPASSSAEAQAMVSKIIAYEQTPPEDWHGRVLFVADNQPDEQDAGDFWDLSEGIASQYLPEPYTTTKVYYDRQPSVPLAGYPFPRPNPPFYPSVEGLDGARTAILNAMDAGHLFVNYIGHGAPQQWAAEKLLRLEDIASLDNVETLPVMLPWTCREGYFIYPYAQLPCIGESIVRADGKGAIASWSPTGFGTCAGHHLLNVGLFDAVFEGDARELGPATMQGKLYLWYNSSPANRDVRALMDTYVLFGDPALRLNTLPADVQITKGVDPAGPVQPGDAISYTMAYANAGPATAHNVAITDLLPSELNNAQWTASDPGVFLRPGTAFVWDVGDLAAGAGGTITISAIIDAGAAGSITNRAIIASTTREANPQDNAARVVSDVGRPVGGTTYIPFVTRGTRRAAYAAGTVVTILSVMAGGYVVKRRLSMHSGGPSGRGH